MAVVARAGGGLTSEAAGARRRARSWFAAGETAAALGLALTLGRGLPAGAWTLGVAALWLAAFARPGRRSRLRAAAVACGIVAAAVAVAWLGRFAGGSPAGAPVAAVAALVASTAAGAWRGTRLARATFDGEERGRSAAGHATAWLAVAVAASSRGGPALILVALALSDAVALLLGSWHALRASLIEEAAWDADEPGPGRWLRAAGTGVAALSLLAAGFGAAVQGPAARIADAALRIVVAAMARVAFPVVAWALDALRPHSASIREVLDRMAQGVGGHPSDTIAAPAVTHGSGWVLAGLAGAAVLAVLVAVGLARLRDAAGGGPVETAFSETSEMIPRGDAKRPRRLAWAGAPATDAVRRVRAAYRRWSRSAARHGHARAPSQTAREHARRVTGGLEAAPAAAELVALYERARYGGVATAEDARRAGDVARDAEAEVIPVERGR
ncbi:MAG: DUF4129 domain-containing protein [Clostridia bacterium]|nr:DUF4129 domain-containing protein [Clostridia bacterium]